MVRVADRPDSACDAALAWGGSEPGTRPMRLRACCIWVYAYPAFLMYAAHSAGGYWARILPQASEIAS
jgi:hypothetical protein